MLLATPMLECDIYPTRGRPRGCQAMWYAGSPAARSRRRASAPSAADGAPGNNGPLISAYNWRPRPHPPAATISLCRIVMHDELSDQPRRSVCWPRSSSG